MNFIQEKDVLDFYLGLIEKDKITFLVDRPVDQKKLKELIIAIRDETQLHNRIQVAKKLWKQLFTSALTSISSDKKGYDDLFDYFDTYVDFEELIFASDSFYRDHTLHCLWVYFLGEYLTYEPKFQKVLWRESGMFSFIESMKTFLKEKDLPKEIYEPIETLLAGYPDMCVLRCLSALTHDLGYPLKKIKKVNGAIRKVLPYFGIERFSEFDFEYSNIHMPLVEKMVENMSISTHVEFKFRQETKDFEQNPFDYFKYCDFVEQGKNNFSAYNIKANAYKLPTDEIYKDFKDLTVKTKYQILSSDVVRYTDDFENYNHGIMSAYILFRQLNCFKNLDLQLENGMYSNLSPRNLKKINTLTLLFKAIADHTSNGYRIDNMEDSSAILAFVDEIEEFSRISRANQNRQFIEEFCKTSIDVVDGCLEIAFVFDNAEIDNLNPEMAFKSRCKRMLSLMNIPTLPHSFHMKMHCIGKLPQNTNVYTLEIKTSFAQVSINGEAQDIPKYLKSNEFYTTEDYMTL